MNQRPAEPPHIRSGLPPFSGPSAELELHIRLPFGSFPVVQPSCRIDGFPVPVHWGVNRIAVPAGRRTVSVSAGPMSIGHAQQLIVIPPGEQRPLHYAAPMHALFPGALGPEPQPRPGKTAVIVIVAVILGTIVLSGVGVLTAVLTMHSGG